MSSTNTQEIKAEVSVSNINDQICALLYSLGKVDDYDDITELKFDWPKDASKDTIIPINIKIKSRQEVQQLTNG